MRHKRLSLLAIMAIVGGLTNQVARGEEQEITQQSARFWARGNTYAAAYDSDEATRANPATLAEADKIRFQLRWLQLDTFIGQNAVDTANDLVELSSAQNAGFGFLDTFSSKFGKRQSARVQLAPLGLRIMQFELSPFVYTDNFLDIRTPTLPEVGMRSDTVAGANIAFGKAIRPNILAGVTVRPFYRMHIMADMQFADVTEMAAPDSNVALEDYVTQRDGMGLATDFGGVWKVSPKWRLALLAQNLTTWYFAGDGANPPPLKQNIMIGSHTRIPLGPTTRWDFLADYRDIVNDEETPFLRHLNLGTEIGSSYFTRDTDAGFALGLNEGYFCAGIFADAWLFRVDLANYAVELGENPGQRMDRRWALSIRSTMTF